MPGPSVRIELSDVRSIEASAIPLFGDVIAVEILTTDRCGTNTEVTIHLPRALAGRAAAIAEAINTAPVAVAAE